MTKKLNILSSALISSFLLSGMNVHAANQDWYAGVSLGTTTLDTGISGTTGTAALDESDSGYKIMIGKKIDKTISIEGFYADFGEASLTGNNGDTFVANGTTWVFTADNASIKKTATGIGINAKFTHEFTSKSSIAGRIGLLMWDGTTSANSSSTTAASDSSSGSDLFYGIGYKYNLTDKYSLVVDYDMYKADTEDFDMVSIGVNFNF